MATEGLVPDPSLPAAAPHVLARRRAMCVWLGTMASWRGGLVKSLVGEFGSVGEVVDRQPAELTALLLRSAARSGRGGGEASASPPGDARSVADAAERQVDRKKFTAVLAAGPQACAGRPMQSGRAVVAWCDALYPPGLRQLADPPLCLFVAAQADREELQLRLELLSSQPAVAIVGTRAPSPYGSEMAALLGRDLARRHIAVVSGLAMGIDADAHRGALSVASGAERLAAVAVLGCGADVPYPRVNESLYRGVLRHGLVVSEFTWGTPGRAWRFPARNRVMAALALGVVIVEGAARSGARYTAGFAADLGREVLAVPGEAGRRLTQAPHGLLRGGASLCESVEDVIAAIAGEAASAALAVVDDPSAVTRLLEARSDDGRLAAVLRALERAPLTVDQAAAELALRAYEAAGLLSELEIEGLATRAATGEYRLRRG